jgi:endonuclease/exonuclease/phosphatase family metal-dependent hydrolase
MKNSMKNIILISSLVISTSCSFAASIKTTTSSFSIMTYNVENLFDTKHDEGKKDWSMLPLAFKKASAEVQAYCASMTNDYYKKTCLELDWSDEVLAIKIKQAAKVIRSFGNGGADIVVFEEMENLNAMKLLVSQGLAGRGYEHFALIDGPDSRGIDVGLISRFPIISKKLHTIDLAPHSTRTTRGILEVEILVGGRTVTVFANHWPSQGNNDFTRLAASEILKKIALKSKSDIVIATGDFNTLHDDAPHAINTNVLPIFEDVEVLARRVSQVAAPGTHWYKGEWESLDKIFVLKTSLNGRNAPTIDYKSFNILYLPFMLKDLTWTDRNTGTVNTDKNIPNRFDAVKGTGFSDHLPVAISINL